MKKIKITTIALVAAIGASIHHDSCEQQVCTRITSEIAYLKVMQFYAEDADDHAKN